MVQKLFFKNPPRNTRVVAEHGFRIKMLSHFFLKINFRLQKNQMFQLSFVLNIPVVSLRQVAVHENIARTRIALTNMQVQ